MAKGLALDLGIGLCPNCYLRMNLSMSFFSCCALDLGFEIGLVLNLGPHFGLDLCLCFGLIQGLALGLSPVLSQGIALGQGFALGLSLVLGLEKARRWWHG